MTYELVEEPINAHNPEELRKKAFDVINATIEQIYNETMANIDKCVNEGKLEIRAYVPNRPGMKCEIHYDIIINPKHSCRGNEIHSSLEIMFNKIGYNFEVYPVFDNKKGGYYDLRIGEMYTISWKYPVAKCCVIV